MLNRALLRLWGLGGSVETVAFGGSAETGVWEALLRLLGLGGSVETVGFGGLC